MEGGIRAWEGLVAEGPPEAGMLFFSDSASPEERIGLAWLLEEGTRRFYSRIPAVISDTEAGALFHDLTVAEEHHMASLIRMFKDITGTEPAEDFPASLVALPSSGDIMEGGMAVEDALQWIAGKNVETILELAISLETNSYDLYIKLNREVKDEKSRHVFDMLASEEKNHLERLAALLERKM